MMRIAIAMRPKPTRLSNVGRAMRFGLDLMRPGVAGVSVTTFSAALFG